MRKRLPLVAALGMFIPLIVAAGLGSKVQGPPSSRQSPSMPAYIEPLGKGGVLTAP
jgi:hypothetical protein